MTWKRVATAAVLTPFAVGLALWSSTAVLALALALVVMIALFEYFSLGDAIGHRAYRYWTVTCAWILIYAQWCAAIAPDYGLPRGLTIHRRSEEHTSELQSQSNLVCRLLLERKKTLTDNPWRSESL